MSIQYITIRYLFLYILYYACEAADNARAVAVSAGELPVPAHWPLPARMPASEEDVRLCRLILKTPCRRTTGILKLQGCHSPPKKFSAR